MWEQENLLTLVPGYTDNIATDVHAYLLGVLRKYLQKSICLFKTSLNYLISKNDLSKSYELWKNQNVLRWDSEQGSPEDRTKPVVRGREK